MILNVVAQVPVAGNHAGPSTPSNKRKIRNKFKPAQDPIIITDDSEIEVERDLKVRVQASKLPVALIETRRKSKKRMKAIKRTFWISIGGISRPGHRYDLS